MDLLFGSANYLLIKRKQTQYTRQLKAETGRDKTFCMKNIMEKLFLFFHLRQQLIRALRRHSHHVPASLNTGVTHKRETATLGP